MDPSLLFVAILTQKITYSHSVFFQHVTLQVWIMVYKKNNKIIQIVKSRIKFDPESIANFCSSQLHKSNTNKPFTPSLLILGAESPIFV